MGTITKLKVNIPYLLFTKKETIMGEKVKVVGILNWKETQDINYSVTVLANNEKAVALTQDTDKYLTEQFFYKCVGLTYSTKTKTDEENNKVFLVWDDIIDSARTTQLKSNYIYQLTLTIDTNLTTPIAEVCQTIKNTINNTMFNGTVKSDIKQIAVVGQNDYKLMLDEYMQKFEDAKSVISKIAALKQIESLIEILSNGMIVENMNKIAEKQEEILTTVATISEMIS